MGNQIKSFNHDKNQNFLFLYFRFFSSLFSQDSTISDTELIVTEKKFNKYK